MFSWFERIAPIRIKFRVLLAIYTALSATSLAGAVIAAQGTVLFGLTAAAGAMMLIVVTTIISGRLICTPYVNTVLRMEALARGDTDSPILYTDYEDCVGRMTKAMAVFGDNARQVRADAEASELVVDELGRGLDALAARNMTYSIERGFDGDYDRLRVTFNRAVADLEQSLSKVATSSGSVHAGSNEIRSASEDLARRTEQQAASLEETSTAMTQVTGMVAETAKGAAEVHKAITAAHDDAAEGGKVVGQAVGAMDAIQQSSQEIEQIINLIDGIAFQTNLLALNAGVEAARAGDAGKGFAVVANEVRALAQRSADAAKDIKALITTSSNQVSQGVALVGETGTMLERILTRIGEVNGLIAQIATGADTQARNLQQVNESVNDMDRMTQQNAAMVEESTAASRSLAGQADELAALVAGFQLKRRAMQAHAPFTSTIVASPPRRAVIGNLAVKADEEGWAEF